MELFGLDIMVIVEYLVAVSRTILSFFGVTFDDETSDNLESMIGDVITFDPKA